MKNKIVSLFGRLSFNLIAIMTFFSPCAAVHGSENTVNPKFKVQPNGTIEVNSLKIVVTHYTPGWQCTYQNKKSLFLNTSPVLNSFNGKFKVKNGIFAFNEKLTQKKDGGLKYNCSVSSQKGVDTKRLCVSILLPDFYTGGLLLLDKQKIILKKGEKRVTRLIKAKRFKRVEIPCNSGKLVITGNLMCSLFSYHNNPYHLRIFFEPPSKLIKKADITFNMHYKNFDSNDELSAIETPLDKIKTKIIYRENHAWLAIEKTNKIIKGSALDFSFLQHSPAGKFGAVKCINGKFRFTGKPEENQKFYGINLTYDFNFPSHREAEIIADYLARMGYNAVRFHHFDQMLTKRWTLEFDEERHDRMDYLIHCLKERGIYYTIDLFTLRKFKQGQFQGYDKNICFEKIKLLLPVNSDAMKNMQQFAGKLLLHKNPYTKMAMKDDPAFVSISIINENTFFHYFSKFPDIVEIYKKEFLKGRKDQPEGNASIDKKEFYKFVLKLQVKSYEEMKNYLRSIGVEKPLTDMNFRFFSGLSLARRNFDYVDNHCYWDHARYQGKRWGLPFLQHHKSMITDGCSLITRLGGARIVGKPFTVSEFTTVAPSPYRAEMAPIMSSFAALQGWDAIYRYQLGSRLWQFFQPESRKKLCYMPRFHLAVDIFGQFAERIASYFFRLKDNIPEEKKSIPYAVSDQYLYKKLNRNGGPCLPAEYTELGLKYKIGILHLNKHKNMKNFFRVTGPEEKIMKPEKNYLPLAAIDSFLKNSKPGPIQLDKKKGTYTVAGKFGESISMTHFSGTIQAKKLGVKTFGETTATCFAGALDKKQLHKSSRILLLFLTDTVNEGMEVEYSSEALLKKWGFSQTLARKGRITFSMKSDNPEVPDIWALKYDGSKSKRVKVSKTKNGFSFVAQAVSTKDTYFAFEAIWQ